MNSNSVNLATISDATPRVTGLVIGDSQYPVSALAFITRNDKQVSIIRVGDGYAITEFLNFDAYVNAGAPFDSYANLISFLRGDIFNEA